MKIIRNPHLCSALLFLTAVSVIVGFGNAADTVSDDLNVISKIEGQLKDGSARHLTQNERQQMMANIGKLCVAIQARQTPITNAEAKGVLRILAAISDSGFADPELQDILNQQIALACLPALESIELDLAFQFICLLRVDSSRNIGHEGKKVVGKDWESLRNQIVESRLKIWNRIGNSVDPNWDPKDGPSKNVMPPPGSPYPSGGDPEGIADPVIRNEYKSAIKANEEKRIRYNHQSDLRELQKRYAVLLKKSITDAYGMPPVTEEDLATLRHFLQIYVSDMTFRQELLEAVKIAIKSIGPN